MEKYRITFKEVCRFHVDIDAESLENAIEKAREIYDYNPPDTIEVEEVSAKKLEGEEAYE